MNTTSWYRKPVADKAQTPLDLQWGRNPAGRFVINLVVAVADPRSQTNGHKALMYVPLYVFVLSPEEEVKLKQSLTGLSIVTELPK